MPPKRKTDAIISSDGAASEPVPKSVKSEPVQVDGVDVQWQYEDKPRQWLSYPEIEQPALTAAYLAGKDTVLVDGGRLLVDVKRLTQKLVATRYSKRIRLAVKAVDGGFYVWYTVDSRKRPTWYAVADAVALEKAHTDGAHDVRLSGGADGDDDERVVNLVTMMQDDELTVARATAEVPLSERKGEVATPEPPVDAGPTQADVKEEPSKGSRKKESKVKASGDATPASAATEAVSKTVFMKGRAPVDSECKEKLHKAHVYCEGSDVWDCMLNQTYLQNNNNKYYLIQLLEDDEVKRYSVWMRWGRVGKRGQMAMFPCGPDLEDAKGIFAKKFQDKTKNEWARRSQFKHIIGMYDLIKMDYSQGTDEVDTKSVAPKKALKPSTLDQRVQDLLSLICDVRAMEEAVVEMSYDARKAPLGMLTKSQLQAGYEALKTIESFIKKGSFGSLHTQACNDYYTRIPHDFGMQVPPLIKSEDALRREMRLVEALSDIEIAVRVLKLEDGSSSEHPLDRNYRSLQCDIKPLGKSSDTYKLVKEYLETNHASTHTQYSMELVEVFQCDKSGECSRFVDCGNRTLLWHGSRITNWMGILCTGLRVAPPEAPVTGYMFGKGIYFADMSSKSANYCFPTRTRDTGLVGLFDVSLGSTHDLMASCYTAGEKLPADKHSVKGLGRVTPDPATHKTLPDGTLVPVGKGIETAKGSGYTLNYNEYIVYKSEQQKLRYICKVRFNFK